MKNNKQKEDEKDEKLIKSFLIKRELTPERFKKEEKNKPTPDFKVYLENGTLGFYCEVKSIRRDKWLDDKSNEVEGNGMFGGARNDPVFNRLTRKIETAVDQFDSVNYNLEFPNVLAFINHDLDCDHNDLIGVITGTIQSKDGSTIPVYRKFSEGRIFEKKFKVHLYLWFQDSEEEPRLMYFNESDKKKHEMLSRIFSKEPLDK